MELKTDWDLEKEDHAIEHHGVLGMKWGVRRSKSQLRREAAKRISESKDLTDDELRSRINRLTMEKQYRDLVNSMSRTERSKSKEFITRVLTNAGDKSLTNFTALGMDAGLKALVKQVGGEAAVRAMYNSKKVIKKQTSS